MNERDARRSPEVTSPVGVLVLDDLAGLWLGAHSSEVAMASSRAEKAEPRSELESKS